MTSITTIQSGSPIGFLQGVKSPSAPGEGADCLLPAPLELPSDPLMALLALQSKSRRFQLDSGMKDVQNNKRLRAKAHKEFKRAIKKAQEAKKKGGFWKRASKFCNKLSKYGAVVAAVALAVGSGGAGAPASLAIAGAVLSSASMAQSEYQLLQKMGVSDDLAGKMEMGMALGGAACTGGASVLGSTGSTLGTVQKAVAITSFSAKMTDAAATTQIGHYDAEAREHESDALFARLQDQQMQRMFDQILAQIEGSEQSEERAMNSLRGAIETRHATPLIVARRV